MGRRVLVTGLASFWGGRVAQALEEDPTVEVIVGLDQHAPNVELQRTEYVRSDEGYSILARIVRAARIDTIVHTFLIVDSTLAGSDRINEVNTIGTMNLFAAASAPDTTVRNVVVKSSTLVYGATGRDPYWFSESTRRVSTARTAVERSLLTVEQYVRDFREDNPQVTVATLRFANVLGTDIRTPLTRALDLPVVPHLAGFDPRVQFVHEVDVVRSLLFALDQGISGAFNVAGDGTLPWSEVAAICGKRRVPLPSYGMWLGTKPLATIGVQLPQELLDLLKYGRGVDNRRFRDAGFRYQHTSASAVEAFARAQRLRRVLGERPPYRFEPDVEQFFRHSPAVVRDPDR